MPSNTTLAARIRQTLEPLGEVEEKQMMGGLTFMYNGKMCVGIFKGELMCRIGPAVYEAALEQRGCHAMVFGGKTLQGYVLVDETGMATQKDFDYWINLAIEFNSQAKASKKKKGK